MARPLRILYEGAWYHIMNRGAAKKDIFYSDLDRTYFLELLGRVHEKYRIEIHAYCLMSNHYHLLVRTPLSNLSQAIKYLNGLYVQRINSIRNIDGPLFRGRFKSIVIEDDEYLRNVSRYIHLNPVEANLCEKPWEYKWSSCREYLGHIYKKSWLYINNILNGYISAKDFNGHSGYVEFLSQGIDDKTKEFYKKAIPVFGSDDFVDTIRQRLSLDKKSLDEVPENQILQDTQFPSFNTIIKETAKYYCINVDDMKLRKRGVVNLPRNVAIYIGIHFCNKTLGDIETELENIKKSAISKIYSKMLAVANIDLRTKTDICNIMTMVAKIKM